MVLRPADVYGPRDQRLLKMFKGVSAGKFPLFGSGEGRRHMVYVDDVVSAFFQACERDEAVGQGLIIAGPRSCTLRELLDEVVRATGSKRYGVRLPLAPMLGLAAVVEDVCAALKVDPPIYRRRMDFFHSDSEFDTSRARRVLDWEPKVDLREGIRRTLEDYTAEAGALLSSERSEEPRQPGRIESLRLPRSARDDTHTGDRFGRALAVTALSPFARRRS